MTKNTLVLFLLFLFIVAKDKASSKRKKASSQTKKIEAKLKAKRAAKRDNA